MNLFFIFTFLFAQEAFSPEKYSEQISSCDFSQARPISANPQEDIDLFLNSQIPQITRRYPLSSPWIQQESFLQKLGEALYKNEANCKNQNLTHWSDKEDFPSLGLPHAIWYPATSQKKYREQFPELIYFIQKNLKKHEKTRISWPQILTKKPLGPAPWTLSSFSKIQPLSLQIESSQDATELLKFKKHYPQLYPQAYELFEIRHFLANPIVLRLQAQFVVEKTFLSLYRILASAEKESHQQALLLHTQMMRLLSTPEGVLSIVDYLNFKGEGLSPSERTPLLFYSWGLKTVLEVMAKIRPANNECADRNKNDGACANTQFAAAATCTLQRLAQHSGDNDSQEQLQRYVWLNGGWKTRIESNYRPGTFLNARCNRSSPQPPNSVTANTSENL